jgi:O-antigen ligase
MGPDAGHNRGAVRTLFGVLRATPPERSRIVTDLGLGLVLSAVAAAVGVLAARDPILAVAVLAAVVAVPLAVLRPSLVLPVLVLSIFAEAVTVGGTTLGRLTAPLALVAVVSQVLQSPVRLRRATFSLILIGGYALLALASLAWTVSVPATVEALTTLAVSLVYGAAFAVLVRTSRDLHRLLTAFALASTSLALLWIGQYALGIDRRFNVAGDPNFFAASQVVALPLVVVLLSRERDALRRVALYVAIALIAASVLSTVSRGGFITLTVIVLLILVLPSRLLFQSPKQKAAFLLTALIGLAVLSPLAWGDLRHRFEAGLGQSNVAGGRGDLWLAATAGYRQHPVAGLGFGAFRAVSFQLLRSTPGVDLQSHLRFAVREGEFVHNAYLGSLAELGPVGLGLFLGILGAAAARFRRTAREARAAGRSFERSVAGGLLLSLLALALASALLSTETSRVLWVLVGLSLALPGLVPRLQPGTSGAEREDSRTVRWGSDADH